jgi:hypothetical protein
MDSSSVAIILSIWSVVVAALSFGAVIWQAHQAARANELNSFISLGTYADRLDYSSGIDVISRVRCSTQGDFEQQFTSEERQQVRRCVEFLSFAAHLVDNGHLPRQRVWDIYFMSYRMVGQHLMPWWFEHQRKTLPQRFVAVQHMCKIVLAVTDAEIELFGRQRHV